MYVLNQHGEEVELNYFDLVESNKPKKELQGEVHEIDENRGKVRLYFTSLGGEKEWVDKSEITLKKSKNKDMKIPRNTGNNYY